MNWDKKAGFLKFYTSDNNNIGESFHKNLDMLIDSRDITVRELSDDTGIPFSTLSNLLYGNTKDMKCTTAITLAKYFGISIDELLGSGTINPITKESLAYSRVLDEANLYTIRYLLRNLYQSQNTTKGKNKKYINVFKPTCANGHLYQSNVYERVSIDSLSDDTKARVFMGLQMPCEHYMPHFSPYDILLIASDRDAKDGEICVIIYYQRIFIARKHIYQNESGELVTEYLGIRDPKFKVPETDIDNKLGYLVEVFRKHV